jgi:hypothetical protein
LRRRRCRAACPRLKVQGEDPAKVPPERLLREAADDAAAQAHARVGRVRGDDRYLALGLPQSWRAPQAWTEPSISNTA